jgi:hypothetical protein
VFTYDRCSCFQGVSFIDDDNDDDDDDDDGDDCKTRLRSCVFVGYPLCFGRIDAPAWGNQSPLTPVQYDVGIDGCRGVKPIGDRSEVFHCSLKVSPLSHCIWYFSFMSFVFSTCCLGGQPLHSIHGLAFVLLLHSFLGYCWLVVPSFSFM